LARAWTVPLDPKAQEEISSGLNFLLATARIRKFLSLYFRYWQNNCSIFHVPSFDPETTSLPLLAAVTFMGAMYSTDPRETYIAKRVLDFAELFVFSSPVFSPETEVASVFSGHKTPEEDDNDWVKFQNFLAGLIITVVQYWAGSRASRNRAMENRFSEIVKIARRLDLVKCRHQPHEQLQEHLWIQTECRIRAISVISLLDCAFFFYQNYPCRLTHSEMECELPCEESVFQAEHPFSEPSFRFNRDITIYSAFQNLFKPMKQEGQSADIYDMGLTVLDTFILIHGTFQSISLRFHLHLADEHRSFIRLHQYAYDTSRTFETAKFCHPSFTKYNPRRWQQEHDTGGLIIDLNSHRSEPLALLLARSPQSGLKRRMGLDGILQERI
jgi:hypothetical protein